jgi:cardiolipin synthase
MRFMFIPAVCWPVLAWERMMPHGIAVSIVIFLVGFSDVLDGLLARWLRWQTEFGRYTDHLGDTMICSAIAVAETLAGLMPGWLMGIYLFRYGGMLFGGVGAIMFNPTIRITPTWIGRLGTAVAGMVLFLTIAQPLTAPGLKWTMPYLFATTGILLGINIVAVLVMLARGHLARNEPDPRGARLVNTSAPRGADGRNLPENHVKMQIGLDIGQEKG